MSGPSTWSDDPASRLTRRILLVLIVGGFAVVQIPRAVVGIASGDLDRQIASVVGVCFWGWLTWRLILVIRDESRGADPHFHFVSAAGYAAFAVIYLGFLVVDAVVGDFDARRIPFTVLAVGLAPLSYFAGKAASRRRVSDPEKPPTL